MTSLRVIAANRATELRRVSPAARLDQHAGSASFPEALDSTVNAGELSPNSKSQSDPRFETSSSETRLEPADQRTRSAQRTDGEPPKDATQQTSLGNQIRSVEIPVAVQTAGSASADQLEPGSDQPSTGPAANASSIPQAEIGDDDPRRHAIRRSAQEAGAADAAVVVAIIDATGALPTRLSNVGPAIGVETNAPAAVSLLASSVPPLDLPSGGPGSDIPRNSSAENAPSIPFSRSPDSAPNDTAMIPTAHLAATSPIAGALDSVLRETSAFSPASGSSGIGPGPDALRRLTEIAAPPATETVASVLRETSAFSPASASSGFEPGPDTPWRDAAIAAAPATDAVASVLRKTSVFSAASASSGIDPNPDTLRRVPAIAASPASEGIIAAPAGRTGEDSGSITPVNLIDGAPNPIAGNTYLAGSPVEGSAPLSPSNPQPVGLAEQLAHHVMTSIDNGGREFVLQLHPPELGELTVRVLVSGRDVSAWFGSQQIPVQQAINQAIGQLHADLGNAGYNLNSAWVGADASGPREWDGRSFAPPRGRADRSTSQGSPAPPTPSAASGVSIYV